MLNQAEAIDIIYGALRSLNEELEADKRVELSPSTRLFGPDAPLDSLSLVSVIVDVETALADRSDCAVSLTDDTAMSQEISPFSNVTTLADYIVRQLSLA